MKLLFYGKGAVSFKLIRAIKLSVLLHKLIILNDHKIRGEYLHRRLMNCNEIRDGFKENTRTGYSCV